MLLYPSDDDILLDVQTLESCIPVDDFERSFYEKSNMLVSYYHDRPSVAGLLEYNNMPSTKIMRDRDKPFHAFYQQIVYTYLNIYNGFNFLLYGSVTAGDAYRTCERTYGEAIAFAFFSSISFSVIHKSYEGLAFIRFSFSEDDYGNIAPAFDKIEVTSIQDITLPYFTSFAAMLIKFINRERGR